MSPSFLQYAFLAAVAAIFGLSGGLLVVNSKASSSSGIVVAIPAQPYPGQGIPATPAVPAQPSQGKPDIGNPEISYVQGEAGKDQIVNPMLKLTLVTPFLDGSPYYGEKIVGKNFSETKNTIFWDGKVLVRDVPAIANTDGTQEISLPVPTDVVMGSYHSVSVQSVPYGKSNTVQVQAVEHFDIPIMVGVTPGLGSIGTEGRAKIWDSMEFSCCEPPESRPISKQLYMGVRVPATVVKSGAVGYANLFVPTPLKEDTPSDSYPNNYTFTVPQEVVYCPSWGWDAEDCSLAPPNTMIRIQKGMSVGGFFYLIYDYKYRGTVKGMAYYQLPPQIDPGKPVVYTDPSGKVWDVAWIEPPNTPWFSGVAISQ